MNFNSPSPAAKKAIASGSLMLVRLLASLLLLAAVAQLLGNRSFAEDASSPVDQGRAIAFDRTLGNCLACHMIEGGDMAGNIGPPLLQMKVRFPDPEGLKKQIADPESRNPATVMPPYGKHQILTDEEIDLVVEFLYSL